MVVGGGPAGWGAWEWGHGRAPWGSCTLCPVQGTGCTWGAGRAGAGCRSSWDTAVPAAPLHPSPCLSGADRGFCEGLEAEEQQAGPMCPVPALRNGSTPPSSNTNGLVAAYCTVSQRHGGPLFPFSGRFPPSLLCPLDLHQERPRLWSQGSGHITFCRWDMALLFPAQGTGQTVDPEAGKQHLPVR